MDPKCPRVSAIYSSYFQTSLPCNPLFTVYGQEGHQVTHSPKVTPTVTGATPPPPVARGRARAGPGTPGPASRTLLSATVPLSEEEATSAGKPEPRGWGGQRAGRVDLAGQGSGPRLPQLRPPRPFSASAPSHLRPGSRVQATASQGPSRTASWPLSAPTLSASPGGSADRSEPPALVFSSLPAERLVPSIP